MKREPPAWSRTNQLIIAAAERLGVEATAVSSEHSDFFLRLRWPEAPGGPRSVIVSKTRSPFLTQVAQTLANNKFISRELLAARGLPVVPGELFDEHADPREHEHARARAEAALTRWGRVVVKPNWANRGVGIVTQIAELDALLAAFDYAGPHDRDEEVVVEPQVEGINLRVAVIGGRVEAVAEVRRPWLRGDGRSRASELLAQLNADARRGSWQRPALVSLDHIEERVVAQRLAVLGLGLDDVLPAGARVELCFDEIEVVDRSEELHPGWGEVAVEAAGSLGVDVAGVDLRGSAELLLERGPEQPAGELGGVLEVNALPALHLHALPTRGQGRAVFEAFVAYCLQLPGAPGVWAEVRV
jgi:D-alanine-D-alanine ligase-like ATP-grasp enzyme